MIPLHDQVRSRSTPYVNYALLTLNTVVFLATYFYSAEEFRTFILEHGLIPAQLTVRRVPEAFIDLFTSMFLHGNPVHLLGNMLYLWVFGDNVEDAMGHGGYALFYLLGGLIAALAHVLANPFSAVPTVGASGAIAAVLGAYMVLYPYSRVYTIVPLGFYVRMALLPAVLVLGFWFVLQVVQGIARLGMPADIGGVAFWAHAGGFVYGAALARIFARPRDAYGGPNYG